MIKTWRKPRCKQII